MVFNGGTAMLDGLPAIEEGADFVEPDLVMTKDAVLIARHEPEIGGTTNVADHPEFASRRRSQLIDGEKMDGWFTEDFTLAEIKTLRARERLPQIRPANVAYDGKFQVPTFDEIMQLVANENRDRGRKVGVYPETKHPEHFRQLGLPQEATLLKVLERHGSSEPGSRVFIQSFDPSNLRMLRGMTRLPLVQLLEHELGNLAEIAGYADAIGVNKPLATAEAVRAAHAASLKVHVWTFRAENKFLPEDLRLGGSIMSHGRLQEEINRYLARGIEGFFTDHPAIGVAARDAWAQKNIDM